MKVQLKISVIRRFSKLLCLTLLLLFGASIVISQQKSSESISASLYQRLLDLESNLNVLSIALEPGFEDLSALSYLRFGRGAKILSAYVTNGEAGESDTEEMCPNQLAAVRRAEAFEATSLLDGDVYFLNMPDFGGASDSLRVRAFWSRDTLLMKLRNIISDFKPDLIVLARDMKVTTGRSIRWEIVHSDLLDAVKKPTPFGPTTGRSDIASTTPWRVQQILGNDGSEGPHTFSILLRHPLMGKTYKEVAEEIGQKYVSLQRQRQLWSNEREPTYRVLYPSSSRTLKRIDEGIPHAVSPKFRWIEQQIKALRRSVLAAPRKSRRSELRVTVAIRDSIDQYFTGPYSLNAADIKVLLRWKEGIEKVHNGLLGVRVKYNFSETILVNRQLTFLTIDTVLAMSKKGSTELYFLDVGSRWILNEGGVPRLPLKLREQYRLISPQTNEYNLPSTDNGLTNSGYGTPFVFFVIHRAPAREEGFVKRINQRLFFAPRFTTEIITPILRVVPGEFVTLRLTNHSRDGVADEVYVSDSLALSDRRKFRLNEKDASHTDTLHITWKEGIAEGSYRLPIQIGGVTVSHFAARRFDVQADTSKRIAIIEGARSSALSETCRRLNLHAQKIAIDSTLGQRISSFDVLLVDQRALTLRKEVSQCYPDLKRFSEKRGHLIILSQDAQTWNKVPLWEGIQLRSTRTLDERTTVMVDSIHRLFSFPNKLSQSDWEGWLYYRAYNIITGEGLKNAEVPFRAKESGVPLIISKKIGEGRWTYVDLALRPQFLNIHPGAFRLLANLISF